MSKYISVFLLFKNFSCKFSKFFSNFTLIFNLLFDKLPIIAGYLVTQVYSRQIPLKVEIIYC